MTIEFENNNKAAYAREWRRRNSEKVRNYYREYRKKYPEKTRAWAKIAKEKDPEYYAKLVRLSTRLYYAKKRNASSEVIHEIEVQLALHKESKRNRKGIGPKRLFA